MEKNKECVLNKNIFNKYWKLLLLNYNQKDTHDLKLLYYASLKDLKEEYFIKAIETTIKTRRYFPNVCEIRESLNNVPSWFNQDIKKEEATEEEAKELKELLKI